MTTVVHGTPFNVYARAIELEEGQAAALHFGLYETPEMPTPMAQRSATELLRRHLPPPGRLLVVGIELGATLDELRAAGYAVAGISADAPAAAYASLESFADGAGDWDAMLFRESAQHIPPIDLFTQADRLLAESGELVVLDEFALKRTAPGREPLHLLDHFAALAQRFGFGVAEQLDLTRQAAPALDYLLRVVPRHAEALKRDLDVATEELDALIAAAAARRREYDERRAGYFLLRLRRIARPRWRVGRIDGGNAESMRALFAEIFRHPMSEARWRWKYGGERGVAVGVREEGRLIAHYGGVARDIIFFGEPRSAAQICDVMVAPAGRGTLSRQGPLFLAAATYLENQLGYGNPHLLGFGFPSERHYRAAVHLGLYGGPVGRMLEISWPAARGRPSPALAVRPLDLTHAEGRDEADACWSAMRDDANRMIIGVRDASTLRHRYCEHPDKPYQIFVVRRRLTGDPLGLFVLRPDAEGGCELMDVIGPLAAIPRLTTHARRAAASLGASRLFCWVVDNIRQYFGANATVRDLDISVPANAWTAGPPIEGLIGKWWLTGGDTDFR